MATTTSSNFDLAAETETAETDLREGHEMTDPFIANVADAVGDQEVGRKVPRFLQPFRTPAYRRLAVALVLSSFASGVWIVGLVWEVIGIGGTESDVALVSTAAAVGLLLPALLGGVVADRVPQKLILIGVASIELLGMSLIAALSLAGLTQVWHLMLVSFAAGVGMAFYYPAYSAWLPALVPEQDLMAVNGFEGMVRPAIGQAIGPAVAGAAIASMSPGAAIAIAAGSSALGLLALLTVPMTAVRRDFDAEQPAGNAVATAWRDIRAGFAYMVRTPWLLATLLFASAMLLVVMGPLEVLTPFLIKDELGGNASGHASVLAAFGIGGAIGSFVMGSIRMPRRYLTVMNMLWGVACLPFVVYAVATQVWMLVIAGFVLGGPVQRPDGDLGDAAATPGAAGDAGARRVAGLLRLGCADAGVDGARGAGVAGDRAAHHVPRGRHPAGGVRDHRDRRRAAPAGRDRPPAAGRGARAGRTGRLGGTCLTARGRLLPGEVYETVSGTAPKRRTSCGQPQPSATLAAHILAVSSSGTRTTQKPPRNSLVST